MKTDYKFGSRSANLRCINPLTKDKNNLMWLCDNPFCKKRCHYTSECPNIPLSQVIIRELKHSMQDKIKKFIQFSRKLINRA